MSDSCREAPAGSAHHVKAASGGPRHPETTMPKYLLLKQDRSAFMRHVSELLEDNGENVDVRLRP
jgi:hypothetical protein